MKPDFGEADARDADTLLAFMRGFNASQGDPFEEGTARPVLCELLASPFSWAGIADRCRRGPAGYLVLTFGFSLEYGGRDAFVDELFLEPAARGRGLGRAALSFALGQAARLGVRAVHLEVEPTNPSAHALYQSVGFVGNDRQLLTHHLAPGPSSTPAPGLRPTIL